MSRLIYVLFCLSGFIGLMYESLWARYLKLFLGHSSYGQILTLVIYMGGLGVGSFLGARLGKKAKNAFYLYALIELLIGVGGFFYHDLYVWATSAFFGFINTTSLSPIVITLLKLKIAVIITAPVAILLGMTFPAIAIAIMRWTNDQGSLSLPRLYFVNSLGAAIGILITSYFFIPQFGTIGTLTLAAIGNLMIALIFYGIAKQIDATPFQSCPPVSAVQNEKSLCGHSFAQSTLVFWLFMCGLTGLSSFIYEIGWIRLIGMLFGSSTHAFDIMVSAFIAGLAIGGILSRRIITGQKNIPAALAIIQIAMGALALGSVYLYKPFFLVVNDLNSILIRSDGSYIILTIVRYLLSVLLVCPASLFAGMTLPLVTYMLVSQTKDEKYTGHVYGWNTIGSIAGAVLGGLVLLPVLQLKLAIGTGAMIDIILGLVIMALFVKQRLRLIVAICLAIAIIIPVFFMQMDKSILTAGAFRRLINFKKADEEIFVRDGRTATISFHKSPGFMTIKTNGKADASIITDRTARDLADEYTQAAMAFFPMEIMLKPYNAAVIGFGSGMTSHYLLGDTLAQRVDVIEIEPEVYNLSRHFLPYNKLAYESPKVRVIFDDAKTWFCKSRQKYDMIVSEPSNPWVSGVSSLFSVEFYKQILPSLADDGVMVQWMHIYEFNSDLMLTIIKALGSVFPYVNIYDVPGNMGDIVIIAGRNPMAFSRCDFLKAADIRKQYPQLDMDPGFFGERNYIISAKGLEPVLKYYHPNSDYYPLVDNGAEHAFFLSTRVKLFDPFNSTFDPYLQILEPQMFMRLSPERNRYWKNRIYNPSAERALLCMIQQADTTTNWNFLETQFFAIAAGTSDSVQWNRLPSINPYRQMALSGQLPKIQTIRFKLYDAIMQNDSASVRRMIQETIDNLPLEQTGILAVRMMIAKSVLLKDMALFDRIYDKYIKENPAIDHHERLLITGMKEKLETKR